MATHAPHDPKSDALERRPACGRQTRDGFVFYHAPGEAPTCRRCAAVVDDARPAPAAARPVGASR